MTILHWSRLSDRIGRRPVILMGLFGLILSMCMFGLSKAFWSVVLRWVNLTLYRWFIIDQTSKKSNPLRGAKYVFL